jgi:hypothetical protein
MNDANMNDFPNPNTLIQTRIDDDSFSKNMINYSNDIITQDINQYKSCPIMINTNCIDNNLNNIHLAPQGHQILNFFFLQHYFKMAFVNL